jgi:hypothetical protein
MKYYIIYLREGKVVDLTTWDDEETWNNQFEYDSKKLAVWGSAIKLYDFYFDEVQKLHQVC